MAGGWQQLVAGCGHHVENPPRIFISDQITKLKLVKRRMYGRAKIDLLQARLIGAT
jgi:transposase